MNNRVTKNTPFHKIKTLPTIIILAIFLLTAASCSTTDDNNQDTTATLTTDAFTAKYTSSQLYDEISSAMKDLPQMTVVYSQTDTNDTISLLTDLDPTKITDYVFAYSMSGTPEEIAVIQVKSPSDAPHVKKDLEARLNSRQSTFAAYTHDESQLEKFTKAKISIKSNYITLIIGTQAPNAQYALDTLFKQ